MIQLKKRCLRVDVSPGNDEKNGKGEADGCCEDEEGNRQRRNSDWPFSNALLALVEQRKSRLNSVRQADGSLTATCVFYAVRVRWMVSRWSGQVSVNHQLERSTRSPTPWRRPREMVESEEEILASLTWLGEFFGSRFPNGERIWR